MTSSTEYLVDPYLLCKPASGDWLSAAESIISWASHGESGFAMSPDCLNHLSTSYLCPYFSAHQLDDELKRDNEYSVPAGDLFIQARRLLDRIDYRGTLAEVESVTMSPIEFLARQRSTEIASSLQRWLVFMYRDSDFALHNGILRTASRPGEGFFEESVATVSVSDANMSFALSVLFAPPSPAFDIADFMLHPAHTLRLAYDMYIPDCDKTTYPLRTFEVGSAFIPSIRSGHLNHNPTVLRNIVKQAIRILSGQESRFPSLEVHPQRIGVGPNDPQEIRLDGALAFRATVTVHGAGYRLHYWKLGPWYELRYVRTESE